MWNTVIGLPFPPVNAVAPTIISDRATELWGLLASIGVLYALKNWRDTGRPFLLLIILGGGMTTLVEPLVDLLGACWHPIYGQATVFELLGRPIPPWIISAYFAFFGTLGVLLYSLLRKGISMNVIRIMFVLAVAFDVLEENITLPTGLYIYYGHQPLMIFGMLPWWWAACNSIGLFVGIALVTILTPYLKGLWSLTVLLLLPLGDVLGYSAIGVPSFIVVNAQFVPNWLVQLAGLATFILAALLVQGIALLLGRDSPLRQTRTSDSGSIEKIATLSGIFEPAAR